MITKSMVASFLEQAPNPEKFKSQVVKALLCSTPVERNRGIALRSQFAEKNSSYRLGAAESILEKVYTLTDSIFPGAFATYGREKSFLSFLRKLLEIEDVSMIRDHYALRLVLSDDKLGIRNTIDNFLFLILRAIIDQFQEEGFIVIPLETKVEKGPPKDIRKEMYIPKTIPESLIGYEQLFKNYVCCPKNNGYQGLHLVLMDPEGITTELQIWTTSMARRNNHGPASHDGYKPKDELDKIALERGDEFKELLIPKRIGRILKKDSPLEEFDLAVI